MADVTTLGEMGPGRVFRLPDGRVCLYDGHSLTSNAVFCYVPGTGRRLPVPRSTPVELIDVPALLAENDDLRGLLADACEDSRMWAAGVEAGRGEAAALADGWADECEADCSMLAVDPGLHGMAGRRLEYARRLAEALRALGPARPPPRPHALEAEAARLRGALRGLADAIAVHLGDAAYYARALAAARKALGDA